MKELFLIAGVSVLLGACGGGGSATVETAPTPKAVDCTKPTEQGPGLNLSGSGSAIEYSAMPKLQNVTVSGSIGTFRFKECSFVKTLTISGSGNTVEFDASSDVETVVFAINSASNTVKVKRASAVTVQNLGNQNDLIRRD